MVCAVVGVVSGVVVIAWVGIMDGLGSGVAVNEGVACSVIVVVIEPVIEVVACGKAVAATVPLETVCNGLFVTGRIWFCCVVISWMGVYSEWGLETAPPRNGQVIGKQSGSHDDS